MCQIDMHVRFWNNNQVHSRYLTSFFLGHHTAEQIHKNIEKVCSEIGFQKLIGPNLNWKVFALTQKKIEKQMGRQMHNVGSCGLDTLHKAFRAGCVSTDWDMGGDLSSLKWLFKDVPARREDCSQVTGSTSFPLDFCSHRWLENVEVAEHALQILSSLKMYITAAKTKKVTESCPKSFEKAGMVVHNDLSSAKIYFFLMVASTMRHHF